MQATQAKTRLDLLDSIRGATLLSMAAYHTVWDLVYLFGVQWDWYKGGLGFLWQQSICWTFIFLSGFCWPLGRRPLKRGLTVLAGGAAVTLVTVLAMPESRVVFGVLTLLGSCALLLIPLEKLLRARGAGPCRQRGAVRPDAGCEPGLAGVWRAAPAAAARPAVPWAFCHLAGLYGAGLFFHRLFFAAALDVFVFGTVCRR